MSKTVRSADNTGKIKINAKGLNNQEQELFVELVRDFARKANYLRKKNLKDRIFYKIKID